MSWVSSSVPSCFVECRDITLEAILIHKWCILFPLSLSPSLPNTTTRYSFNCSPPTASSPLQVVWYRPLQLHGKRRMTRYDSSVQRDTAPQSILRVSLRLHLVSCKNTHVTIIACYCWCQLLLSHCKWLCPIVPQWTAQLWWKSMLRLGLRVEVVCSLCSLTSLCSFSPLFFSYPLSLACRLLTSHGDMLPDVLALRHVNMHLLEE